MDFTNRDIKQSKSTNETGLAGSQGSGNSRKSRGLPGSSKLIRIFQASLLVAGTILIVAVLLSVSTAKNNSGDENLYVDTGKYQAVFLNGGQVYFGKIIALNNKHLALSDIYYLQVIEKVQPGEKNPQNNFTLTKLGCELHRPQDVMVINKEQVIFWENLKDEAGANTVPGAIKSYKESTGDKPQDCNIQSQQSDTSNGSDSSESSTSEEATNDNSSNESDTTENQ